MEGEGASAKMEHKPDSAPSEEGEELVWSLGKAALNSVLLLFFIAWLDLFGLWILPVALYVGVLLVPSRFIHSDRWSFSTRMEVRSVVVIYFTILSVPILIAWCALRGGRYANALLLVYVAWYTFLDDAPQRGGRFCRSLRQRKFWGHFAAFFPMKLTRSAELDPTKNYIFGYHPHGIISVGALCNFATEATGFAELFPGIDLRLLTLAMNFRVPLLREYLLGLGVNDVSSTSCRRNLGRGPGASIMIVVGGARESLETKQGHADLVLEHRKGFVKMALKTGASLVPVFSFGENDVFGVYHSSRLAKFQIRMQKKLGFAVPFFFGRALTGGVLHRLFGLNVGVMPLRVPIHSVVGRPIHLEKVEVPSQEQIDEAHKSYVKELKRIYEEWHKTYEQERAEALKNCNPERVAILKSSNFHLDENGDLSLVE